MTTGEHYNPLLVTVLPKERRARHPYQICAMLALFATGLSQQLLGTLSGASAAQLDPHLLIALNWFCILGGAAGTAAAFIPERVVRWFNGWEFDATYWRLWEELGSHVLTGTVWASYFVTISNALGIRGLSVGSAAGLLFTVAAIWRSAQIVYTMVKAGVFSRRNTAIIGIDTIKQQASGG